MTTEALPDATPSAKPTPTRGERFKALLRNPELRGVARRIATAAGTAALEGAGLIRTDTGTGKVGLHRDGLARAAAAPAKAASTGLVTGLEAGIKAVVHEGLPALKQYVGNRMGAGALPGPEAGAVPPYPRNESALPPQAVPQPPVNISVPPRA